MKAMVRGSCMKLTMKLSTAIDEDAGGVIEHSYEWMDASLIDDWRETAK